MCQNRGDATQGVDGGGSEMSTNASRGDFGDTAGTGELAGVAGIGDSWRPSDLCCSALRRPASWLERTMSSGDGVWKSKRFPSV